MNCKQTRENLVLHTQDSTLKGADRRKFLQHLRGCHECQIEYEGLWQTASVLGSLEPPEPPAELLGNIQNKIRKVHKQRQTAFFAHPISWLFGKCKLDLSPKYVNGVALLCYIAASIFLVKFAFFSDEQPQDFGFTAFEETRLEYVRISPSQLASVKYGTAKTDEKQTAQDLSNDLVSHEDQFVGIQTSKMWNSLPINRGTEAIDVHLSNIADIKLTLFWSDIKTDL
ncbi:MAG: hypothetical protein OXD54_14680 [Candidatus Poribacteria bacterium]|nr:hypothetical protein [Candidatus Poribacteria bacterium]